jgi:hypothetical protein
VTSTDTNAVTDVDTVALTVQPVNDAPVLDSSVTPVLNSISEDAGPPIGAVGTLISDLVDFSGGGGLDNVTDSDSGALLGIAVTSANTANGTWFY